MQDTRKGRSKGALFVRLPQALREQIAVLAQENRRSLTAQVTMMLEQWVSQEEKNAGYLDFHRRLQAQVHGDDAEKEQE